MAGSHISTRPGSKTISDLPNELLGEILKHLIPTMTTTPATTTGAMTPTAMPKLFLLNAALVNKQWREEARRHIEDTVELVICTQYAQANMQILHHILHQTRALNPTIDPPRGFRQWTKHIIIRDLLVNWRVLENDSARYFNPESALHDVSDQFIAPQLRALVHILRYTPIEEFTWAAITPLPFALEEVLRTRQSPIQVHIKRNYRAITTAAWSYCPVANFAILRRMRTVSPLLVTLELCLPYTGPPTANVDLKPGLQVLLQGLPKLQHLNIYVLTRHSAGRRMPTAVGHVEGTGSNSIRFDQQLLSAISNTSLCLKSLALRGVCGCVQKEGEDISRWTDLTKLRALEVSCLSVITPIVHLLGNLDSFTWYARHYDPPSPYYHDHPESHRYRLYKDVREARWTLWQLSSLSQLHVYDDLDICRDPDFLYDLGPQLTHLTSVRGATRRVKQYSSSFIANVAELCPWLESFTCSIASMNPKIFISLGDDWGAFRRLQHLHLYQECCAELAVTPVSALISTLPMLETLQITIDVDPAWDRTARTTGLQVHPEPLSWILVRTATQDSRGSQGRTGGYHAVHSHARYLEVAIEQNCPACVPDALVTAYERSYGSSSAAAIPRPARRPRFYPVSTRGTPSPPPLVGRCWFCMI